MRRNKHEGEKNSQTQENDLTNWQRRTGVRDIRHMPTQPHEVNSVIPIHASEAGGSMDETQVGPITHKENAKNLLKNQVPSNEIEAQIIFNATQRIIPDKPGTKEYYESVVPTMTPAERRKAAKIIARHNETGIFSWILEIIGKFLGK